MNLPAPKWPSVSRAPSVPLHSLSFPNASFPHRVGREGKMERKLWETEEIGFGIASLFLGADPTPWLFLKVSRKGWSAAFKFRGQVGGWRC